MRLGRWFDKVFVTRGWGLEDGSLAPILRRDTVVRHLELHYWDNGDGKIFKFCWAPTPVETISSGSLRNLVSETTVTCTWTRVCEHLFTVMQYTHKHPDGLSITFSTWEMNTPRRLNLSLTSTHLSSLEGMGLPERKSLWIFMCLF